MDEFTRTAIERGWSLSSDNMLSMDDCLITGHGLVNGVWRATAVEHNPRLGRVLLTAQHHDIATVLDALCIAPLDEPVVATDERTEFLRDALSDGWSVMEVDGASVTLARNGQAMLVDEPQAWLDGEAIEFVAGYNSLRLDGSITRWLSEAMWDDWDIEEATASEVCLRNRLSDSVVTLTSNQWTNGHLTGPVGGGYDIYTRTIEEAIE